MKNLLKILLPLLFLYSCSGLPDPDLTVNFSTPDTSYTNKVIPQELRIVAKEALSYYPELSTTPIEFRFEDDIVNSFMQAQPKIPTLFKSGTKRAYVIKITRRMNFDSTEIPIEKIPHDVLLGWLGHELGHIIDYTRKSSVSMIWFGFTYLTFDKSKMRAERRADIEALNHGLSDEIIATKNYILNNSSLSTAYKARIREFYLSPEQILELVTEMEEELNEELKEVEKKKQKISKKEVRP